MIPQLPQEAKSRYFLRHQVIIGCPAKNQYQLQPVRPSVNGAGDPRNRVPAGISYIQFKMQIYHSSAC
jgi:hypothetical protein